MITNGIWNCASLRLLKPILRSWQRECRRYTRVLEGGDVCWWFNERANVGTFAIAAARQPGWVALEEFSSKKGRVDELGVRRHSRGRCDLYLANRSRDYAMEFKHAWQPLFAQRDPLSVARNYWSKAWTDAGALYRDEADLRLAGLFVVPHHVSIDEKKVEDRLELFLGEMKNLPDVEALAWWFPQSERKRRAETGRYFPGVALALRRRRKATRQTSG